MAMMGSQGTVLTAMVALLLPAQALAFSAATVLPTPRVTALAPHSQQWRTALPALGRRSFTPRLQEAALPADGGKSNWPAFLPPRKELKKVLPLGLMFFCILFNYTILRDTKDVLVVTAPKSGAEIIPFLKTYVNLPGAIGFTVLYSRLTNKYSREKVFYGIVTTFLAFFALFAMVIYPSQAFLHPNAFADWLTALLPAGFVAPIAIIRNWTYAVFYTMAELWGSVIVSLLFWGFANEISTVRATLTAPPSLFLSIA